MKLTSYFQCIEDLILFKESNVDEVILEPRELSRFGKLSLDQVNEFSKTLCDQGFRVLLEWDILMTENVFEKSLESFEKINLEYISAIRVQDPGAYQFLLEQKPNKKIHLILETGNHNLKAIKSWIDYGKKSIERIVLSLELPKEKLIQYKKELDIPIEFLGLGRILLFYTPRSLVSGHFVDHDEPETQKVHSPPLEVIGSSEESPHSGFPIIENKHGTFMFNTKEHCLLENLNELKDEIVLDYLRIDLRFIDRKIWLKRVFELIDNFSKDKANQFKNDYPAKLIRGFYRVNKTDVLFGKLKNKRIQRKDDYYIGDVVEVLKGKHVAIMLRNPNRSLKVNDSLFYITPDGKEKHTDIKRLWNSTGQSLDIANHEQVVFVPHTGGVSIRTAVYFKN